MLEFHRSFFQGSHKKATKSWTLYKKGGGRSAQQPDFLSNKDMDMRLVGGGGPRLKQFFVEKLFCRFLNSISVLEWSKCARPQKLQSHLSTNPLGSVQVLYKQVLPDSGPPPTLPRNKQNKYGLRSYKPPKKKKKSSSFFVFGGL